MLHLLPVGDDHDYHGGDGGGGDHGGGGDPRHLDVGCEVFLFSMLCCIPHLFMLLMFFGGGHVGEYPHDGDDDGGDGDYNNPNDDLFSSSDVGPLYDCVNYDDAEYGKLYDILCPYQYPFLNISQ